MVALQKISTRKAGDHVWVSYISAFTGKRRRLSKKETGILKTKEDAQKWVDEHMAKVIAKDTALLEKHGWRSDSELVILTNQFKAFKKLHQPKSWQVVFGALENYVLPYFVLECGLKDPNDWHPESQKFKGWLLTDEANKQPGAMSVSNANKAINTYNKFCEWMRDHARVLAWDNCRQLQAYPSVMLNRRGAEDLLDNQEFTMVAAQLRTIGDLYADMFIVQRHTGMRVGELCGLSLTSVTTNIPHQIGDAFVAIGLDATYGAVYLDSQPRDPYIKRYNNEIPRKPLKSRPEISPKYARTIPIFDKDVWNILAKRFADQRAAFSKQEFGPKRESYLLFDGTQRNHYLDAIVEAYKLTGLRLKTSHCLRHTRTTELTLLGLPDKIQELVMGHKGLAQARYQHIVEVINRKTQEDQDFDNIKVVG